MVSQYLLFLQRRRRLARSFTRTRIGTRALTTHRQPAAVTKATVAANVHQTLDVHGGLASQVTFDGEQCDLVADFFQIGIGQIVVGTSGV